MKYTKILIILFLSVSCNTTKFKVGQCVQKPDSLESFKIISVNDNFLKLQSTKENALEITDSSTQGWMLINCPNKN